MASEMGGNRLPDAQLGERGPGWDAWNKGECPPGSYMKVSTDWEGKPGRTIWFINDPFGHIGSLGEHTVEEHEDGTITVNPSILSTAEQGGYHGWLRRGIWTEA